MKKLSFCKLNLVFFGGDFGFKTKSFWERQIELIGDNLSVYLSQVIWERQLSGSRNWVRLKTKQIISFIFPRVQ